MNKLAITEKLFHPDPSAFTKAFGFSVKKTT
jgi:hypothetical protein